MLGMSDQPIEDLALQIAGARAGPRVAGYLSEQLGRILEVVRADASNTQYSSEQIAPRADALLSAAERMARLSAAAGWWAPASTVHLWGGTLAALMPGRQSTVTDVWEQLATYPVVLLAYSLGIGASASRRYDILGWLFASALPDARNEWRPLVELIHPYTIDERVALHLRDVQFQPSPLSDHLHAVTRPLFSELLPRDDHFEREFDRFELLDALAHYHLSGAKGPDAWVPMGRALRHGRYVQNPTQKLLTDEGSPAQAAPELLRSIGCNPSAVEETISGFHAAAAKQLSRALVWRR